MLRKLIPAAAAAAIIALPASASADGPTASAAGKCKDPAIGFAGTQYVVKVKTKGLSCGKGLKVIKAHQKAGAGNRTVSGYSCKTKKVNSSPTNYYATAKCTSGSKSVSYGFQRNT